MVMVMVMAMMLLLLLMLMHDCVSCPVWCVGGSLRRLDGDEEMVD